MNSFFLCTDRPQIAGSLDNKGFLCKIKLFTTSSVWIVVANFIIIFGKRQLLQHLSTQTYALAETRARTRDPLSVHLAVEPASLTYSRGRWSESWWLSELQASPSLVSPLPRAAVGLQQWYSSANVAIYAGHCWLEVRTLILSRGRRNIAVRSSSFSENIDVLGGCYKTQLLLIKCCRGKKKKKRVIYK